MIKSSQINEMMINECVEFQRKLNEQADKFNGQATKVSDENPHMSLDKIESYLTAEVKIKEPT